MAAGIANRSASDTTRYRGAGNYWREISSASIDWNVAVEEEE